MRAATRRTSTAKPANAIGAGRRWTTRAHRCHIVSPVALLPTADPEPVDVTADEAEQRGQQRDRGEHRDDDGERRADREAVQERQSP